VDGKKTVDMMNRTPELVGHAGHGPTRMQGAPKMRYPDNELKQRRTERICPAGALL